MHSTPIQLETPSLGEGRGRLSDNQGWTRDEVNALLPEIFPLLWKHREKIYADYGLYLVHIPYTISQFTTSRVGPLMKAWEKIEYFKLKPINDEGAKKTFYVYDWTGSPFSGSCSVQAVCLETGEIIHNTNHGLIEVRKQNYENEGFGRYTGRYIKADDSKYILDQGIKPATFTDLLNRLNEWESL